MYPMEERREFKIIDVEIEVVVDYWGSSNYLQDYKIYGTVMKMFITKFLSNLWQKP
jgi:hypothetical protein